MNNAELIDGLRCCAESTNVVETCAVEDCPYHPHSWSCIDDMLRDAADALEAADKRIAELEKSYSWKAYAALEESIEGYKTKIAELEAQMPKEGER